MAVWTALVGYASCPYPLPAYFPLSQSSNSAEKIQRRRVESVLDTRSVRSKSLSPKSFVTAEGPASSLLYAKGSFLAMSLKMSLTAIAQPSFGLATRPGCTGPIAAIVNLKSG